MKDDMTARDWVEAIAIGLLVFALTFVLTWKPGQWPDTPKSEPAALSKARGDTR